MSTKQYWVFIAYQKMVVDTNIKFKPCKIRATRIFIFTDIYMVEVEAMSNESNTNSSVQVFGLESHEIDSSSIKELSFTNSAHAATTEQVVPVGKAEEKDLTTNFFIVGGVINISMILAYFVWAFFQWKKIDKRKK